MSTKRGSIEAWWEQDSDPDGPLLQLVDALRNSESGRRADIALHLALYGDDIAKSFVGGARVWERLDRERLAFNLVKSVCDAAQAQIASQSTRARVLTQHGDWSLRRRAQKLENYLDGVYEMNDVHAQSHLGFLDAAKVGITGFKVYPSCGEMKIELIRPGEITVDPVDGQYRNPRNLYQECYLPRAAVLGCYGTSKELIAAIEAAPPERGSHRYPWLPATTEIDTIRVVEAWRTPDPEDWKKAQPGRHVVAIKGATLLDEEWDRGFPFVFFRYDTESTGFWGSGMAKNLRSLQRELNFTLMKLQDCMRLNAGYRVLLDRNGKIDREQITDSPGEVLYYDSAGAPPMFQVSNTVPEQFFRHIEDIIRRGFEQEGVSLLGATSRKPAGLDSGAAIREYNDVEAARFVIKAKAFERFVGVHLARLVIQERAALADSEEMKPVRSEAQTRRGVRIQEISWADAAMEAEDFSLQVFPASALPIQPAGRMATVESWMAAGLIDRDQAMRLLDFPDLDDFQSQELAPHEIILDAIEIMVEEGRYVPPEPVQDLQLTAKLAINAFQRHEVDGAPEERTELILLYLEDARAMAAEASALAAANQQAAQPAQQQVA